MRCPQCGNEMAGGAAFCARCGTRLFTPKPEDKREYALVRVMQSWWHFAGAILLSVILVVAGFAVRFAHIGDWRLSAALMAAGFLRLGVAAIERRSVSWSLTSERLIERRGLLAKRRREMELADVRSVEVNQRLTQRMTGIGTVTVASAASADFVVRLNDIGEPEKVAETLRKARVKRLA